MNKSRRRRYLRHWDRYQDRCWELVGGRNHGPVFWGGMRAIISLYGRR